MSTSIQLWSEHCHYLADDYQCAPRTLMRSLAICHIRSEWSQSWLP